MFKVGIVYDLSKQARGGHGTHLAFKGLPGVETVALVDGKVEDIEKRQKHVNARKVYADYLEMFDKERPDIVVIGSRDPLAHHAPLFEAVKRGMHVLCEKPLTATLAEADELYNLAQKNHCEVAVAHLARHALLFRTMKKMIQDGAIGTPLAVYGRGKEDERGGGEDTLVLGTHILDAMNFLFGTPEHLFAEVTVNGRPLQKSDRAVTTEPLGAVAGDNLFAHLHYANNVRGFFESRKGIFQPGNPVRMGITAVGTQGALSMRYTLTTEEGERKLRLTRSTGAVEDAADYEEVPLIEERIIPGAEPLQMDFMPYYSINNRFAAWDLMEAIKEDRDPIAGVKEAVEVLEIIQGIYQSQLAGQRIPLPLADRTHPLE